jgi:hypothetical protein
LQSVWQQVLSGLLLAAKIEFAEIYRLQRHGFCSGKFVLMEATMPRFFFHIRDYNLKIFDAEGLEVSSLDAALKEAEASARKILVDDLQQGRVEANRWFEIVDGADVVVAEVRFRDLLASDALPH